MTEAPAAGGADALYFGGLNSQNMGFGTVPPPRIVYTADGVTFNAVPQTPGTVFGSLPNAAMRGMAYYNGQLFVINGSDQGVGQVYASPTPWLGDNTWQQVSPANIADYDLAIYNGWLYVATLDTVNGYGVWKTQATGNPPYSFVPVVQNGGYLQPNPSYGADAFQVIDGRLYVGTGGPPSELIRINPDDTWDLVVGTPRQLPDGSMKYPLSGLDAGFNNQLTNLFWRLGIHSPSLTGSSGPDELFVGSYDIGIRFKGVQTVATQLLPQMGADLFRTTDGWYFSPITTNGMGSMWDLGFRNFADTPFGLFFGLADEYYGLDIYRGIESISPDIPAAPSRLMVEMRDQQPVLSWDPIPAAVAYHVYRSPIVSVNLPPQPPFTNGGPAAYPDPYTEITGSGGTPDTVYVDAAVGSGNQFLYVVVAGDAAGNLSQVSNVALAPNLTPAMTFAGAQAVMYQMQLRGRFVSAGAFKTTQQALQQAQTLAGNGDLAGAMDQLRPLRQQVLAGNIAQTPEQTDLEIVIAQLQRRIKLAANGFADPGTLATPPGGLKPAQQMTTFIGSAPAAPSGPPAVGPDQYISYSSPASATPSATPAPSSAPYSLESW